MYFVFVILILILRGKVCLNWNLIRAATLLYSRSVTKNFLNISKRYLRSNHSIEMETKTITKIILFIIWEWINLSLNKLKLITKSRPVVLQEVCERFIGVKEFIKDKIEEICCNEILSVEDVNWFCLWKIPTIFNANLVMFLKNFVKCVCQGAK